MEEHRRCLRCNTEGNTTWRVNAVELWRCLQIVISTKQQMQSLRECLDLYMKVIGPHDTFRDYFTGSRGEGFYFDWSDIDILNSSITECVSMDNESKHPKCKYIAIIDKDCQPGFCKLLYKASGNPADVKWRYLSRVSFLKAQLRLSINSNSDIHVHGPCVSTAYGNENGFDQCNAFPIHTDFSNAFLKTFLTKFWNDVKTKVIKENITVMHCVPKCPEKGDNEGLQWLISFTILEQHIVRSLNHLQFCCYGLMKILLHTEIDSCSDTKDTLSSYHLKTVLFHVLEDVRSDFWVPQNIFYCIRICLTRLLLYVIKGCCPNYFNPECNTLLKRKIIENSKQIKKKLFYILKLDVMDLYFSAFPFSNISKSLFGKCTFSDWDRSQKMRNLPTFLEVVSRIESVYHLYPNVALLNALLRAKGTAKNYQPTYQRCIDFVLIIMDLLLAEQDKLKVAYLKHMFLSIIQKIGIIMYDKFILTRLNVYLVSAEAAFMLVTHAGAYEGAYLATLWYCHKKYCHCIELLRFMDLKCDCSHGILSSLISTSDFMTCLSSFDFKTVALDRAHNFFPEELKHDVKSCKSGEFLMQSKSYILFLEFLCLYEMNIIDRSIVAQLQQACVSEYFNLLGDLTQQNSKRLIQIVENKMKVL